MRNQADTFNSVLEKYRFTEHMPPEIKLGIYASRKRTLKRILVTLDDYSFSFGLVVSVLFIFQKAGIKLSLFTCKIILACSVIAATGVSSAGAYKIYKIIGQNGQSSSAPVSTDVQPNASVSVEAPIKSPASVQTAQLEISEIELSGIDAASAHGISEKLYASIIRTRSGVVLLKKSSSKEKIPFRLIGRMYRMGKGNVLTVKIVDSSSSAIQFSETISFNNDENIDAKLDVLAGKIANIPSLWEKK
jgi:hypothetical protein